MHRPLVTIFAGSSTPSDPAIIEAATTLGTKLGEGGYDIIYGAGTKGVMGAVAKAAQAAGAKVTAVILEKYGDEEQLPNATLIYVSTEQERFQLLSTYKDPVAYFALPGGPGSLREAVQQLEKTVYDKDGPPVILVQVGAYLDGIKQYFDSAVSVGLVKADKKDKLKLWPPAGDLSEVIPATGTDEGKGAPRRALTR